MRRAEPLRLIPDPERGVVGDVPEIVVGCQHRQVMTYAQLSQQGIDRSHLHAASAAPIPQLRRADVIVAIGHQQGDGGKPVEDPIAGLRA